MPKAPTAKLMEAADSVSETTQRSIKQAQEKLEPALAKAKDSMDTIKDSVSKYVKADKGVKTDKADQNPSEKGDA